MRRGKLLIFLLIFIFLGSTAVYADTLKEGSRGAEVNRLQTQLKKLGYFKGSVTGYFGSATKAAVKKFQQKKGFIATGKVDDKLKSLIFGNGTSTKSASKAGSADVSRDTLKKIQSELKKKGLYKGGIDGLNGKQTVSAVKQFQQKNGLKITGKIDMTTKDKILAVSTTNQKKTAVKANKENAPVIAQLSEKQKTALPEQKAAVASKDTADDISGGEEETKTEDNAAVQASMGPDPESIEGYNAEAEYLAYLQAEMSKEASLQEVTLQEVTLQTVAKAASPSDDQSSSQAALKSSEGKVEVLDWWKDANKVFYIGAVAKVTDIWSGKSFYIKRTYGRNHADCETLTPEDTEIMKGIWGGSWNWSRRPVILEFEGRRLAASMAGMPHAGLDEQPVNKIVSSRSAGYGRGYNLDKVKDNDMDGHIDVHFLNSRTHGTNRVDPGHQKAVKEAAKVK